MPMAERIHPTDEHPSGTPPNLRSHNKELPEHATPSAIGHIPGASVNPRLNSAAETVGSALGTAVSSVRGIPNKLQDAKARFTVIKGNKAQDVQQAAEETVNRIREAGAEFTGQARERLADVTDQARERLSDLKSDARQRLQQARSRADHLAHEYPLHVMAGAAAVGMLVGIGLRVWRDHAS